MTTENSFNLRWKRGNNNGSPISDYIVQYSTNSGASWLNYTDGENRLRAASLSLSTSGSYLFRVVAVNGAGAGAPSQPAFAIRRPKNNFSAPGSLSASFSVVSSFTPAIGNLTYQWQLQTSSGWVNLAAQTSATLQMTPSLYASAGGDYSTTFALLRCQVAAENFATVFSAEAHWLDLTQKQFYGSVYIPDTDTYPQGQITENAVTYDVLNTTENAQVQFQISESSYLYDDISWFTGNNWILQLQTSSNGISWSDNYSVTQRSAFPSASRQIAAPAGTTYWRWRAVYNWPFTASDGTTSADRAPYAFTPYYVKIMT
jgi:hypothetical protein